MREAEARPSSVSQGPQHIRAFRKERAYAEAAGCPWFILSAEHGLVSPMNVLAPYNLRLSSTSSEYRRAWGRRVVDQLREAAPSLDGKVIEIHAGSAYASAIREGLTDAGAIVVEPLEGLTMGPSSRLVSRTSAAASVERRSRRV